MIFGGRGDCGNGDGGGGGAPAAFRATASRPIRAISDAVACPPSRQPPPVVLTTQRRRADHVSHLPNLGRGRRTSKMLKLNSKKTKGDA